MQDRYLYRAKRIDKGVWVEGNLIHAKKDYYICENPYECMNEYSSLNGQSYGFGGFKLVDSSTICQCTGLKDKSGKLIFENDIVRICDYIVKVLWCDEFALYRLDTKNFKFSYFFGETFKAEDVEIIGNIFDNQDLLQPGKEACKKSN